MISILANFKSSFYSSPCGKANPHKVSSMKNNFKFSSTILLSVFFLSSLTMTSFSQVIDTPSEEVLMERLLFSEDPKSNPISSAPLQIENGIRIVLWNLYRFNNMEYGPQEFSVPQDKLVMEKIEKAHFLLFQEQRWNVATETKRLIDQYLPTKDFLLLGHPYPIKLGPMNLTGNKKGLGIGLLSKTKPTSSWEKHSLKPERTGDILDGQLFGPRRYKNALAATYPFINKQGETKEILIINLHNLVSRSTQTQNFLINWSLDLIASHKGPAIFGGDFNTWNFLGADTNALVAKTEKAGLNKAPFFSPISFMRGGLKFQMDHLFYKGLILEDETIQVFKNSNLSDHPPVSMTFKIP